uniref:SBP-type domain-containing protein n=1 Tax=Nelumbo nucifera TaxID=4432 RepID=A0A822XS58_NELNU|nr:TPA_asm: hypothetical protein HUJ06_024295 [Nelumbo nucifera]
MEKIMPDGRQSLIKDKAKKEVVAEEEGDEEEEEVGGFEDDKRKRTTVVSPPRRKGSAGGGGVAPPCCQAEKCTADLTEAKRYHRRHKVCEQHAKAPVVLVASLRQRFCQQCSRSRSTEP